MRREYVFDPEDPDLELSVAEKVRMRTAAAAERKSRFFPELGKKPLPVIAPDSPPKAKPVLKDEPFGPPVWARRKIEIRDIARASALAGGISLDDILGKRRIRKIVVPRQIAMAAARIWTGQSMPEIGRRIGYRDHTTVLHAINQVMLKRAAGDPDFLRISADLSRQFDRHWPEPTDVELAAAIEWKRTRKISTIKSRTRNGVVIGGALEGLV